MGVLHAGGKGTRAYPTTKIIPKVMLKVEGKYLIERNLEILRDKLKIKKIFIVTGYLNRYIKRYFGNGSKFGVEIEYIDDSDMKGLAHATYLLKDYISEPFIMILGDEVYASSNHNEIQKQISKFKDLIAMCGIIKTKNIEMIKKNYSVQIKDGRIYQLVEKPKVIKNKLLGCGTYVLTPKFFEFIYKTPPSKRTGRIELTDVLNNVANWTGRAYPFFLKGEYTNINKIEDRNTSSYIIKNKKFHKYRISLIIPSKNEEKSIRNVIKDFVDNKSIQEIIVVDNSEDNTAEVAKKVGGKKVRIIQKPLKYGAALKYGMDISRGDIIVMTEADFTFRSKDLQKMLEYMKDADMVIGTRTTRQLIEQGSNMGWFLRWGNVGLGKLLELLWLNQEPRFTDVGCTFRAIWKTAYVNIRRNLHSPGTAFSPEMMIEALKSKLRVIEIPVSYYPRLSGESKNSEGIKTFKTGLGMLNIILGKRFGWKK